MLQQVRMPYVRFETAVAQSKDADGHAVYRNVYYANITPAGGKDEVVKIAEDWIKELQTKGEARGPFDGAANEYYHWYEHFSKAFDAFKKGEEMTTSGTPLRACMAFTKAEVQQAESVRIFSLEDLSVCNEEAIRHMGVGGRHLQAKAAEVLKNSVGNQAAEQVAALKLQVETLTAQVLELSAVNTSDNKARVMTPH
jgi:hypothetical protein